MLGVIHTMKNILGLLLLPSAMLIAIAIYCFILPSRLAEIEQKGDSSESHKQYEKFVSDVVSGKAQGSPDQYIHAMQVQQITIKNEREHSASVLDSLKDLGWGAVYGIVFQLVAIYYIRKRLRKL